MDISNSVDKAISPRTDAISLTNEIIANRNNMSEIPKICNKLIRHLFMHQYLFYTDLNNFFESNDVLIILIQSLERLAMQPKRDVLRIIHLFIHTSLSLRDMARQSDEFLAFLRKNLDQAECWENRGKFKHHVNIASQLLVDKDSSLCSFNNASVRQLVRKSLDTIVNSNIQENEDVLPSIVFYACSMFSGTFEDIPTNVEDEPATKRVLTKYLTGKCLDLLRDYIQDFKVFYTCDKETSPPKYILYKAKSEYSFHQLCKTITYYSYQSKELRMNIHQAGIYEIIRNLLSLVQIPETFLACGIDVLKLSCLDELILLGVKNSYLGSLNSKLNAQLMRASLSDKMKTTLRQLLRTFDVIIPTRGSEASSSTLDNESIEIPFGDFLQPQLKEEANISLPITNMMVTELSALNSTNLEDWTQSDVKKWLEDNHLEDLRETFSYLSGGGLKQLQMLARQQNKMAFVEFFIRNLRMRLDMTLELLNALEKL